MVSLVAAACSSSSSSPDAVRPDVGSHDLKGPDAGVVDAGEPDGSPPDAAQPDTCVPATCSEKGFQCGSAYLGCGKTEDCGTCPGGQACVGNACIGAPDGGGVQCTGSTYLTDCPTKPCAEPTGCSDAGACQYQAFQCPLPSDAGCPVKQCSATAYDSGVGYQNSCVEVAGASCGLCPATGPKPGCGVCVGSKCRISVPRGTLVTGALRRSGTSTAGKAMVVRGNLTFVLPGSAKTCTPDAGACISGGVTP